MRIKDGDPILLLSKKGPIDWCAHKAAAATSDGGAAAACMDKGAKRALTVEPANYPFVRWCESGACWSGRPPS